MAFRVRRLVTGHGDDGRARFESDGTPPLSVDDAASGYAVSNLWQLGAAATDPESGGDPQPGPWQLEPEPGGMSWRLVRMPPPRPGAADALAAQMHADPRFDPKRPGFHRTDTLDFVQILGGRIALELHDEELALGPGDCVVQRGTWHRWRVLGDEPCLYQVVMLRPEPGAAPVAATRVPRGSQGGSAVKRRRVVTDVVAGRSVFASDAPPARAFATSAGLAFADLWQTAGPLCGPLQGGDLSAREWRTEPAGRGISWRMVTIPPERALARVDPAETAREFAERAPGFGSDGEHHPERPGLHRTDTIDLLLVLEGEIELGLPGEPPRVLRAGDTAIQRGTWHEWHNRGDAPCSFSAVMIATPRFRAGRVAAP